MVHFGSVPSLLSLGFTDHLAGQSAVGDRGTIWLLVGRDPPNGSLVGVECRGRLLVRVKFVAVERRIIDRVHEASSAQLHLEADPLMALTVNQVGCRHNN